MADLDLDQMLDRGFAAIEQGVAEVGAVFGLDLTGAGPRKPSSAEAAAGSLRPLRPFRVDSVIDADTGREVFLVTDGAGASVDCPSKAAAEGVLDALAARGEAIAR